LIRLIHENGLVTIQWSPDKEAVGCNTLVYVVHSEMSRLNFKTCHDRTSGDYTDSAIRKFSY
jgi:hypothetical protein